jgi:MOSC domain-containing protein YiiM
MTDPAGTLLSVNVGLPKDVRWQGKTVFTGVFKDAVAGRHSVRKLNVEGDGQGDLAGHGGEERAVFVYQIDSYRHWERELGRNDFVYGQFGENFTVEGLDDDEVCSSPTAVQASTSACSKKARWRQVTRSSRSTPARSG